MLQNINVELNPWSDNKFYRLGETGRRGKL